MAQLNISEAARRWGKSRQTIYSYLNDGRLSGISDKEGNTLIDTSEMIRVFGEPGDKTSKTGMHNVILSDVVELRQLIEIERLKRSHSEELNNRLESEVLDLKQAIKQLREQDERRDQQLQIALNSVSKLVEKQLPEPKKPLLEQITSLWKK